jgi:heme a synthase
VNPRFWGWATLVANVGLVGTGGLVRLTGSGLGCPTWPQCTADSYFPRGAISIHAAIEFGNRMLTFVLVGIAVLTWIAARRSARKELVTMALVLAFGIPVQALIGGITVLTDLNPWIVSLHLVCSMAIISLAVVFIRLVDLEGGQVYPVTASTSRLAQAVFVVTGLAVYLGTIVTGSGPHAGDADAVRNGLDPEMASRIHALAVYALIALTCGLLVNLRRASVRSRKPVLVLLGVQLLQGALGYWQYFTGLPIGLVFLHLVGSALVLATATWVWHSFRRSAP